MVLNYFAYLYFGAVLASLIFFPYRISYEVYCLIGCFRTIEDAE